MTTLPPSYPGTIPVNAKFAGIYNKHNIYADFSSTWEGHTSLTAMFDQHRTRSLAGIPGYDDIKSVNDFYRTNRYDLASHWVRSFDASQVLPLPSVASMTNVAGRRLVVLMDQHISQSGAILAQGLNNAGIISNNLALTFFNTLKLIPNASYNQFKAYDAITDIVTNGVQVISLYANVAHAIANGVAPMDVEDIVSFNQVAYDQYNQRIADSKLFKDTRAMNLDILASAGVPSSVHFAQDAWNAHLVEVAILISKEVAYSKAWKAGNPVDIAKASVETTEASTAVLYHSNQLAALQAASVGVPSELAILEFPLNSSL